MLNFTKQWRMVFVLCLVATWMYGQKMHMFIVSDDTDANIGSTYDYPRMQSLAQNIATKSGLSLVPYYFQKSQTTSAQLAEKINNLNCGSDDVVWFYYTGHGFNPNDGSVFTAFSMPDGVSRFKMDLIESKIKSKNPRLTIVMYDACNWMSNSGNSITNRGLDEAHCRQLFRQTRGVIKVASNTASSGAGKYSYGNSTSGGFFTSSLVTAMYETNGDWHNLMAAAKSKTQAKAVAVNREQVPYYILTIEQNPAINPPVNNNNLTNTPDEPSGSDF